MFSCFNALSGMGVRFFFTFINLSIQLHRKLNLILFKILPKTGIKGLPCFHNFFL